MPETEQPPRQPWPAVERCDAFFANVEGGERAYGSTTAEPTFGFIGAARSGKPSRNARGRSSGVLKKT
tara:strand:+ start:219 stop:422 length:204 start_codon:yes stop_codon:yes gene_type:complete